MNNSINIREQIISFFLDNPETTLSNYEVAQQFNFLPNEKRERRTNLVKKLRYKARHTTPESLALRSRWQQRTKEGEMVWLESYRKKDSDFIIDFTEAKNNFLDELRKVEFKEVEKPITESIHSVAVEISLFDYHFGKEDGRTLEQQVEDYVHAVENSIALVSNYPVERFIFPIGNDMFHIDNTHYSTTDSTRMTTNSTYGEIFKKGTFAVIKAVEKLSKITPVDVIVVQGNHDRILSLCAGEVVSAYFHNHAYINVINLEDNRTYYTFGKNLIGYTHGDKGKKENLPLLMAVEKPLEFATCPYRYWRVGHFHHLTTMEIKGIDVTVLPSLTGPDKWHKDQGYISAQRVITSIFSKEFGFKGYLL